MPFLQIMMLNFPIPVLGGHLAIPRGWPLNTGIYIYMEENTYNPLTRYKSLLFGRRLHLFHGED